MDAAGHLSFSHGQGTLTTGDFLPPTLESLPRDLVDHLYRSAVHRDGTCYVGIGAHDVQSIAGSGHAMKNLTLVIRMGMKNFKKTLLWFRQWVQSPAAIIENQKFIALIRLPPEIITPVASM